MRYWPLRSATRTLVWRFKSGAGGGSPWGFFSARVKGLGLGLGLCDFCLGFMKAEGCRVYLMFFRGLRAAYSEPY